MSSQYNYEHFTIKPYQKFYRNFQKILPLGSKAPNFSAFDLDGKRVKLSDYIQKRSFIMLEFGCMTCAPAVTQAASYQNSLSKRLAPMFVPRGVEFLFLYTRETHPGENVRRHRNLSQKISNARNFQKLEDVQIKILVDNVDGRVHKMFGLLPNMAYILDKEGRIVYKSSWTDTKDIEGTLENLLLWEREGFTPLDSVAIVEKYHFVFDRNAAEHKRIYQRSGERAVRELRDEVNLPI